MAAIATEGVVNHRGEVFDTSPGRDGKAGQPGARTVHFQF